MRRGLLLLPLALLAACGPLTVQDAEKACYDEASLAAGPRGEVRMGVAGGGGRGTRGVMGARIDLSTDYLMGRDPEKVWERCVQSRSGKMPTRPLHSLPRDAYQPTPGRFF